jgi:hydrogenase-4 component B
MFEILFPIGIAAFLLGIILPLAGLKIADNKTPRRASLIMASVASASLLIFSLENIFSGKTSSFLVYQITLSFQFSFLIDRLSAFFIALISIVSLSVAIYSVPYVEHIAHQKRRNLVVSLMALFIVSMVLVVASFTMFSFLFFWEIMALSSFFLVMTEYEKKDTVKAGIFYFVMTHLSTLFLLFAFLFLGNVKGTFDMNPIAVQPLIASIAFVFLFLGFGIKAGIIPFHKWLPYAHPASPSNISALMSGVMIKVAIYGVVRFVLLLPMETWWGLLILLAGTASAVLGVVYALKEHDLKRLLAYHSIENIGIILIGVGLYVVFSQSGFPAIAELALVGALFHTLNHAIFKSLLFMTSGSIINVTGTRNIEEMGGLIKRMPATAMLFFIGALSISALPPFNGFISELMIFQAFFQSTVLANPFLELILVTSLVLFALTSALAAACFVKAFGITFLALPRSEEAKNAKEAPKLMIAGPAILAALCVGLGVFSFQILGFVGFSFPIPNMLLIGVLLGGFYVLAFAALRAAANRRERIVETWGCGIITQTAKMEYTASGFSEPIVTVLKSIFRTQKRSEREYFDDKNVVFKSGKAELHLVKFFEERLYIPIGNIIKKISQKINDIQRGDVDLHVAYVFATVVVFLLLIWWLA